MKQQLRQQGFTLVELAIVLTIIGLLIGGILKGQQLITNARVTATMAQMQGIQAAMTTFQDTYSAIAGDMLAPGTRIPGITATPGGGGGDNIIGANNVTWAAANQDIAATNAGAGAASEPTLVWAELSAANLISGIANPAGISTLGVNVTHPAAKVGGVLVFGYYGASAAPLGVTGRIPMPTGNVVALTPAINSDPDTNLQLTPGISAQIDRKQDDGNPASGNIQAVAAAPAAGTCTGAAGTSYVESSSGALCNLLFYMP